MRASSFLLCALLFAPALQANELMRVYQQALDNDAQLLAAAKARDAALQGTPIARGALLPQVTAQGDIRYDRTEVDREGFPSETDTGSPYGAAISLSLPVYNARLWKELTRAGREAAVAEAQFRATHQALALRVAEAYFNVLAAYDSLRFAEAENKAVERQLEQARQRFEVGLSAITDVQEAQARYDLTVAQQIEAEQQLALAHQALAEITNASQAAIAPLQDEIPLTPPTPAELAPWLKAATENNLDVIIAQLEAAVAHQNIAVNRAQHYPVLDLRATKAIGEERGALDYEFDREQVMLQLTVPLFTGGTVASSVTAAERRHEQRLALLEAARRTAERRTRDAYQGVMAGIARVNAFKQAVVSSTTALEASEVGLQVGTRTAVDVLNAQRELYRAQRDLARARYDYLLNILRLKQAAGRLGAQDLAEIDRLLTAAEVDVAR